MSSAIVQAVVDMRDGFVPARKSPQTLHKEALQKRLRRVEMCQEAVTRVTGQLRITIKRRDQAVRALTLDWSAQNEEAHRIANEQWADTQARLLVLQKILEQAKKETPWEYKLRWAANEQAAQERHAEKARRAINAQRRIVWSNQFWPLRRAGLVEADVYVAEESAKIFAHTGIDPLAYWPEKKPRKPSQKALTRAFMREAARCMRQEAREAVNHHEGKQLGTPRRVARKFAVFIATTNWEWDRWSHTLRWVQDPPQLKAFQRLFPRMRDALRRTKIQMAVDKAIQERKARLFPSPPFEAQMEMDEWTLEQFKNAKPVKVLSEKNIRIVDIRRRKVQPQMDQDAAGEANTDVNISHASTTVKLDATSSSVGSHVPVHGASQRSFCGPCDTESSAQLAEREFPFATMLWETSQPVGHMLKTLSLPEAVIVDNADQPNFALFSQHRYWKGDMEVEVKINSNARQFGQLIMSWWYSPDFDKYFDARKNVWSASQNMHCLATANTSNSGKLSIPYRYVKPYLDLMRVKRTDGTYAAPKAILGRLHLQVLVPLTAPSSGAQSANVTLFIRFTKSCFSGVVHRKTVIPNMFTALMAAELIKTLRTDNNRDMPVVPSNPKHIKPITNANYAAGTAQSRTSAVLRLNPHAVTPYDDGRAPDVDEMMVPFVVSVFGLVKQIKWNAQHLNKTSLLSMEADPLWAWSEYPQLNVTAVGGTDICQIMPPVAIVASMFHYWRGEIDLRFDVVGATELTGRLMISFVPTDKPGPSYDECVGSYAAYMDLQENRSFVYRVPYVSDQPWRPRRYTIGSHGNPTEPILGYVTVHVVNRLVPNNTIPDHCWINVYVRGAPSFEVAVPAQPILGLCWNNRVYTGKQMHECFIKEKYYPTYAGQWREFMQGKYIIMRYGTTTDHVSQLDDETIHFVKTYYAAAKSSKIFGYFRILDPKDRTKPSFFGIKSYEMINGKKTEVEKDCKFLIPWTNDPAYMYLVPTDLETYAKQAAQILVYQGMGAVLRGCAWEWRADSAYWKVDGVDKFALEWVKCEVGAPIPQGDERFEAPNVLSTEALTAMTGYGKSTFGETFCDLKDLIRRTELYMERSPFLKVPGNVAAVILPVFPQGMELQPGSEDQPNVVSNMMRHSIMSIVASGYRFFAGSMGLKVKSSCASRRAGIQVQHRPQDFDILLPRFTTMTERGTLVAFPYMVQMRGYATYCQDETHSSVAEVDVPFYQPATCGLLQMPDSVRIAEQNPGIAQYVSLGHVAIGPQPGTEDESADRAYTVWANGGDDLRFFTFQGFPPVKYIIDQNPFYLQMDKAPEIKKSVSVYKRQDLSKPRVSLTSTDSSQFEYVAQMHIPVISDLISAASSFKEAGSRVEGFTAQLEDLEVKEIVTGTLENVKDAAEYSSYFSFLYNAVSNLVHCILNPCWQSVTWAFTSMFQYLFQLKDCLVSKITAIFSKLYDAISSPFATKAVEELAEIAGEAAPQMDDCDEFGEKKSFARRHCGALLSIIISGMVTYLGYRTWTEKYDGPGVELLYTTIRAFTATANGLLTFFKGIMNLLLDTFDWCVARVFPSWDAVNFLASHDVDLYRWMTDVQMLVDGRRRNEVLTNPQLISKMYNAANEACLIQQKIIKMEKKFTGHQMSVLMTLTKEIMKLRDFASGMHIAPPVKFEPFVLQFAGEPKVGKSHLMQEIVIDMLAEVGYKTFSEPIYTRAPGNAYWNGLTNQPVVVYDDYLAVTEGTILETQVSELFQLKTRCVFNPPMAAVEDKAIRYNPIIVGICSNSAYYNLTGFLKLAALHRRRDLLCEVYLDKTYKDIDEVPAEVLRDYGHLRFKVYDDSADEASTFTDNIPFDKFKEMLFATFTKYYVAETRRYRDISARIFRLTPKLGEEEFKFANHEVGESLDKFYERKGTTCEREDSMLKMLLVRTHGLPYYKRTAIGKQFSKMLQNPKDTKAKDLGCTEVDQDHIFNLYLDAYCAVLKLERTKVLKEINVSLNDLKTVIGDDDTRVKLINSFVGQMDDDAMHRHGNELEAQYNPKESTAVEMKIYQKQFAYGCVHDCAIKNQPSDRNLEYDKERNVWKISRSYIFMGDKTMAVNLKHWEGKRPLGYPKFVDDAGDLIVPHAPCDKTPKCPFHSQATRIYFTQKYIESDAEFLQMQLNGDEKLALYIPKEVPVTAAPVKVDFTEEGWCSWIVGIVKKAAHKSWDFVKKNLTYILGIITALIALYKFFCPDKKIEKVETTRNEEELEGQMTPEEYDAYLAARKSRAKLRRAERRPKGAITRIHGGKPRVFGANMDLKLGTNEANDRAMSSIMRKNTFFIVISHVSEPNRDIVARCLGVAGRVAIFPNHYYDAWKRLMASGMWRMTYRDPNMPKELPLDWEELVIDMAACKSIGFITMPKKFRLFKDIRSHLQNDVDLFPDRTAAILYELRWNREKDTFDLEKHHLQAVKMPSVDVKESVTFGAFRVDAAYSYGFAGPGVCGSILVSPNGKFLSMHVAGVERDVGLGEVLGMEEVEHVNTVLEFEGEMEMPEDEIIYVQELPSYKNKIDTAVTILGLVDAELGSYSVPETSLRPSAFTDDLIAAGGERTMEPAVLSPKDPRIAADPFDPMAEGCKFHGVPMKSFPGDILQEAIQDYSDLILTRCEPVVEPRILTDEQTVCGIPGIDYCDSIDLTSSSGWPWRVDDRPHAVQKQAWIHVEHHDGGMEFKGFTPELQEVLDLKHEQRMESIVPLTVFADILKDETLPIAKATRRGGTRVVSMSPLDFTIAQRKYTIPFVASFMKRRLDLEHGVGINPNSAEWALLFRKLLDGGREHFIAADYSKFGDKLPVEIGKECFNIIANWYELHGKPCEIAEIRQVLKVMAEEVFSAKHLCGKTLYQTHAGMPSGNTMTVIFNSMVNSIFMRVAWLALTEQTPFCGIDSYHQLVTVFTYGDDLLVSVDKRVIEYFNTETISQFFADYDLKFTDADKEGKLRPFRSVSELVFLKRGWAQMPKAWVRTLHGTMLAPMDQEVIEQIPYWVDKTMDSVEGSVQMLNESLRLAFTRGPAYYDALRAKYDKICKKYKVALQAPSWDDLCRRTYIHSLPLYIGNYRWVEAIVPTGVPSASEPQVAHVNVSAVGGPVPSP